MSSINRLMNGGFNLIQKQSKRRSPSSSKKRSVSMANSERSQVERFNAQHNVRKCSGGLKAKGSRSMIRKQQQLLKSLEIVSNLYLDLRLAVWRLSKL